MKRLAASMALLAGCLVASPPAVASTRAAASFAAVRVAAPPPLDASLSAPVWSQALVAGGLQQVSTQRPSPFASEFRLLYDAQNLYVGIALKQAGVPITATQGANNVGFGLDDFAGIGIDTSANASQVYFFMTTPRGTRYQSASESTRYAPPWTAVAQQTAGGWNAMLVIPLSVLRTSGGAVQTWRFDFVRRIAALNVNESWAYDPLMNDAGGSTSNFPSFADARFWPQLTGLQFAGGTARRRPRAEVYALASAGADRDRFQTADGNFVDTGVRHAGVDLVVPVTGTAAFVAAIAPDYSNVEVDQQTIAPQEFRRALSEYRPFFTQGANFFTPAFQNGVNAPPNVLFYSPAIGPFTRGLKLEGTQGLQSFGALEARGAGFDDMVYAYRHSLPNHSFSWSLDGVSTHHLAGNATIDPRAGDDTTWEAEISGRNNVTGFVYGMEYAREHGTFVADARRAGRTEDFIDVHRGNYEVFTSYRDIGPLYAPVLGFTQNADVRGPQAFIDLNGTLSRKGPFKRVELFVMADRFLDGSGAVHQADAASNLDLQFKSGLHLSGGSGTSELRTYDDGLVGYPFYRGGITRSYDQHSVAAGWKEGTPRSLSANYAWGPFGDMYLQQVSLVGQRTIGTRWSVSGEIDGTRERPRFAGPADGQWLRRLTVGETLDANTNLSLSLRTISGTGGFAQPGVNLAGSLHRRFRNDSELFVNFGTPAAPTTLDRLVVKYVLRTGGGAGT